MHILNQRCQIQKLCKWLPRPILSAMMFSQPVVLGTPFLKVLSIKTKIAINCFNLFTNFFYINESDQRYLPAMRKLIYLRSCYPFLENSIPFSHRKSCFECERYSSIKIKSIAHSENKMPYFIYSASVNIHKFSSNIFSHSDII